ncbi:hypothetical protein [Streptomyces sp. NPDC096193]|uniref:hypothetical protein n=1 Tax=Streptomyces sp. NPDC096193 TaxID=3155821 RepID=UPI00331D6D38
MTPVTDTGQNVLAMDTGQNVLAMDTGQNVLAMDTGQNVLATDTGQNLPATALVVVLGVIALFPLCGHLVTTVIARRGLRAPTGPGTARTVALWCLTLALGLYVYGVLCCVRLENAYHACMLERYGRPGLSGGPALVSNHDSLFPVASTCTWSDGYTLDVVPFFVNPLTAVLVCGAVVTWAGAKGGPGARGGRGRGPYGHHGRMRTSSDAESE